MSAINKGKRFFGTRLPGCDPTQLQGKLIVLEGADGSGRSTQIEQLNAWLENLGYATANVGLKRSMLVADELDQAPAKLARTAASISGGVTPHVS